MAKRDRLSFDPENSLIKQILHEIATEYDIPPGDLLNAATIEYLISILEGKRDFRSRLRFSRFPRYGNTLDLDVLTEELNRLSGSDNIAGFEPKDKSKSKKICGYIYLIREDFTGFYKIGHSKNVFNRVKTFSIRLPFNIELIHQFPTDDMHKAEWELHNLYKNKHKNGEWFDLFQKDVENIRAITEHKDGKFLYV